MKKFIFFIFIVFVSLAIFSTKFINDFEAFKQEILSKYHLETRTTSLYLQENLKKYLETKDNQILNAINSVFNSNFSSISIQKALFTIEEKELISLSNNLDKKLAWEIHNLIIDEALGQIILTTQSDDLQKELLTIEGSIPNEINKDLIPSSDIYTFIPSEKFKNLSSLVVQFDATNQLDETISSSAVVNFDKNISLFTNNQNEQLAPKWFKDLVPIYIKEESSKVNNSLQNDAVFYININIEKVYFELYKKAKEYFLTNLLWFFISILGVLGLGFIYRILKK